MVVTSALVPPAVIVFSLASSFAASTLEGHDSHPISEPLGSVLLLNRIVQHAQSNSETLLIRNDRQLLVVRMRLLVDGHLRTTCFADLLHPGALLADDRTRHLRRDRASDDVLPWQLAIELAGILVTALPPARLLVPALDDAIYYSVQRVYDPIRLIVMHAEDPKARVGEVLVALAHK